MVKVLILPKASLERPVPRGHILLPVPRDWPEPGRADCPPWRD